MNHSNVSLGDCGGSLGREAEEEGATFFVVVSREGFAIDGLATVSRRMGLKYGGRMYTCVESLVLVSSSSASLVPMSISWPVPTILSSLVSMSVFFPNFLRGC